MFLLIFLCLVQSIVAGDLENSNLDYRRHEFNKNEIIDTNRDYNDIINDIPTENYKQSNPRRFFNWFTNLFQNRARIFPEKKDNTVNVIDRVNFEQLQRNLTNNLKQLTEVLNIVNSIINSTQINNRFKRNTDLKSNTKEIEPLKDETAFNKTNSNKTDSNSRRSMTQIATPTEIKMKLLIYLEETFNEIQSKINTLYSTKRFFSNDVNYKIGYIIANLDTLEVNMNNLKRKMEKNKLIWDDRKILELYDTVIVSNRAVTKMLEILKGYIDKVPSNVPQVQGTQ